MQKNTSGLTHTSKFLAYFRGTKKSRATPRCREEKPDSEEQLRRRHARLEKSLIMEMVAGSH